jgi:hypothetical protein
MHPQCPASLGESSINVQNIPSGWLPYVAGAMYLGGASPTDGPPAEKGGLVNDAENHNKNETIYTYHFEGRSPHGKWIEYAYGGYGDITVAQRLDDSITQCAFRYKKGQKAGQNDIRIQCE